MELPAMSAALVAAADSAQARYPSLRERFLLLLSAVAVQAVQVEQELMAATEEEALRRLPAAVEVVMAVVTVLEAAEEVMLQ